MTPHGPSCLGAGKTTSTLLDELFSEPPAIKQSSEYHTSPGCSSAPELVAEGLDFLELLPAWDGDWGLHLADTCAGGSSQLLSLPPAAPNCIPSHQGLAQVNTQALGVAGAAAGNSSLTVLHGSTSGKNAQAPPELPAAQDRSATALAATHPLWVQGPGHVAAGTGAADPCAAAAGTAASAAAAAMDTTATVAAEAAASASSSVAAAVPCFINGLSAHSALHAVPAGFGQQAQLPQPQRYNDVTVTAYGGGGQQSAAMQVAALHGLPASSLGVGGLTLDRCIGGWSGSNTHDAYPWGQQQGQMQAPGQEHGHQAWMQVQQQQQQQQQWQQRQPAPLLLLQQQQQPLPPPLHQQLPGGPIASWSVAQPQARAPAHMHGSGAASSLAGSARTVGQFPRHLLPQIPAGLCVPPMVPVPMRLEPLQIEPRWSQASSMGTLDRQSCSSYPSFNTTTSELMRLSNGSLRLSTSGGNSSSSSALLTMAPHAPPGVSGWAAAAAVAQQESPAHVLPSLLQHQQQQTWRHTSQQQQQLLQSHEQAQVGKLKRSWSDAAEALGPCAHAPPQARPHHPPGHSGCGTFSSLDLSRTASLPVGFPGCLCPGTVPRVGVPLGHLCAPQVGGSLTTHGSAIGPNAVAPNAAPILGAPCAHAASEAAPTTHGSFGVPTGVNCARVPYAPAATAQSVSQPLALSSRPLSGPAAGSVTPLLPAWLWHNGLNITLNATVPNHPGGIAWAFRASAPEAVVSPLDQLSAIQPRGSATMTTFLAAAAAPVQGPEAPPSPLKAAPLETAPHAPSSAPALQPALSPLPPIPPTHSIIEQTLAAPTRAVTRAAAAAAAPPAAAVTTDSPPASAAFKRLQALFDVPARQAARSLGICVSKFKKRCRRAGIARWPQRRLHCLVRMAELVKAEQGMASDHKQEALALIAANMAEIRADPSAPYNPLVDSLRRSQYKQRSVARRSSRAGTAGSSAARGGRNCRSSSSGSESDECNDSDEGAEEQGGAAR